MKFVGLSGSEFTIQESLDPSKLGEMKVDFAWLDVDKLDSATQLALKDQYGIESINESGFPTIVSHGSYDLILVNYFEQHTKRVVQIFVTPKAIITVHAGPDRVCGEVMASVNEMLVSGGFNSGTVLHDILGSVIEQHSIHLMAMQDSLRVVDSKTKKGMSDITALSELERNSKEMIRIFYDTHAQVSDILLKAVLIKGLDTPEQFSDLYSKTNELSRTAETFLETADNYTDSVLPNMWKKLNKTRGISSGVSIFALSLATAAILRAFFPKQLFGIPILYVVLSIIALGAIGLILSQRKMKFKVI